MNTMNFPLQHLSFPLIFLFSIQLSYGQNFSVPKLNLRGDVAMVLETNHEVSEAISTFEYEKQEWINGQVYKVSPQKQYLEYSQYRFSGEEPSMESFYMEGQDGYIEKGQMKNARKETIPIEFKYGPNSELEQLTIKRATNAEFLYSYTDGKITKTVKKTNGVIVGESLFKDGYISEIRHYGKDGKLVKKLQYRLNEKSYPAEIIELDMNDEIVGRITLQYEYDDQGNYTKRLSSDIRRSIHFLLERKIVYRSDIKNKQLESKDLVGYWESWDKKMIIALKENGESIVRTKQRGKTNGKYEYSNYSETLSLRTKDNRGIEEFSVVQNGDILSLYETTPRNPRHIHLQQIAYTDEEKLLIHRISQLDWDGRSFQKGLKDKQGKVIYPESYSLSRAGKNAIILTDESRKYALGDFDGKLQTQFIYDEIILINHNNYRIKVDDKYGISDAKGNVLVPPIYSRLGAYNENIFISYGSLSNTNDLTVIRGDDKTSKKYDRILFLNERTKFALVSKSTSEWEILDNDFNVVKTFDGVGSVQRLSPNHYLCSQPNRKVVMDKTGNELFDFEYDKIEVLNDFLFSIKKGNTYGLMNKDGKVITPIQYDRIIPTRELDTYFEYPIMYRKENTVGLINGLGQEMAFEKEDHLKQYLYDKEWTNHKTFTLYYTADWRYESHSPFLIHKDSRDNHTIVNQSLHQRKNGKDLVKDVKAIIETLDTTIQPSLQPTTIDGHKALIFVQQQDKGFPLQLYYEKHLFIELDKKEILHFTFSCRDSQFMTFAYDFFLMENFIDIHQQ